MGTLFSMPGTQDDDWGEVDTPKDISLTVYDSGMCLPPAAQLCHRFHFTFIYEGVQL